MAGKPYRFGDIRHFQERKALGKRFVQVLSNLQTTWIKSAYMMGKLQEFKEAVGLWKLKDLGRLPFYSTSHISELPTKINCTLCMVSVVTQKYWDYCNGEKILNLEVELWLYTLESVVKYGLDAYKVSGTLADGYQLKLISFVSKDAKRM